MKKGKKKDQLDTYCFSNEERNKSLLVIKTKNLDKGYGSITRPLYFNVYIYNDK